jgi:hypothetical protein
MTISLIPPELVFGELPVPSPVLLVLSDILAAESGSATITALPANGLGVLLPSESVEKNPRPLLLFVWLLCRFSKSTARTKMSSPQ